MLAALTMLLQVKPVLIKLVTGKTCDYARAGEAGAGVNVGLHLRLHQ